MLRMGFCKPVRFKLNLTGKLSMRNKTVLIHKVGDILVDGFHYLALFVIGATIVWSALHDYIGMMKSGAMVGTYFKTRRLPVQFLIYIAITALSRHLVIDVQKVADSFHLYLLLSITVAIALLSVAILILSYTGKHFGCPEDSELKDEK
jgi:protein PsiE